MAHEQDFDWTTKIRENVGRTVLMVHGDIVDLSAIIHRWGAEGGFLAPNLTTEDIDM